MTLSLLKDLELENLEDLKLDRCSFTEFGDLENCLNLKSLSVTVCDMQVVTTDFSSHKKLESLNLSRNKLQTFENINSIRNLTPLNISCNRLQSIDNSLLLSRLKTLVIGNNEIMALDENIASLASSLEELKAEFCCIEQITVDFSKFENLQRLSLKHGYCYGKDDKPKISVKPFANIISLESLNLERNNLNGT